DSAGTGGAYLADSWKPSPARSHSSRSEVAVGSRCPHDRPLENTRFRYSSRPASEPTTQTGTGSRRSLVSVAAPATARTAPAPAQNQAVPMKTGYSEMEVRIVAAPAAIVLRCLAIGPPRAGCRCPGGAVR